MALDRGLGRRSFLSISSGGFAALLLACGDDSIAEGGGTDGGSSGSGGGSTSGSGPTTAMSQSGSQGTTTQSTDPDGTGTTTADESSSDETGSDTDTPIECEEGEEITWDPTSPGLDEAVFPLAAMSGEMRPESVMFTIYIPDGMPKTFRLWRPGRADTVFLIHEQTVEPDDGGFVKFTVDGLCPGTWYEYGYFVGEADSFTARSRIGNVRTAIAEDALEPLVIALASCCGSSLDWPSLGQTNEEYYDMLLHLGDMAYNDGMETREEYRANWRDWLSTPDYRHAMSNAGMYATWDDHEIDDNSNFDRETMDPAELLRRQNAMDSFFELMPIDADGPDYRLWRTFRWGLTAEIIVLDCRYERRPSQDIYLSAEQMAFLEERLVNSPCMFKIVMNSVPITNMPTQWDIAANDRWDGYQAARNQVRDMINQNQVDNVWFVSGDFHCSFLSRLEPQGNDAFSNVREIACASGNANPIPDFLLGFNPPQFDYGIPEPRGALMTIDPDNNTVSIRFIHPDTGEDDYFATMTFGQ